MKEVEIWAGKKVMAYQDADLVEKMPYIEAAKQIWYQSWLAMGGKDVGSCCGGKAIRVYYLGKGKRNVVEKSIVPCSFVQGNVAAANSVKPALDFLALNGIEAEYYDGWMD
jgi:hypothetical protein